MNQFSLYQAAEQINGMLFGMERSFGAVSTDTRTLQPGDLYVALKGPNFDGHEFLYEAELRGAVAALVSERTTAHLPLILVDDTRLALGRLAAAWRQAFPVPLVAVTGSNGKTTVKEMLAAILSQRGKVLATQGNLNNDIGMPLTLLRQQDEAFAVIEMGANHPGEIAVLSGIARPDVALITSAGAAHLEGFGTLDGVAKAKGEIIQGLTDDGTLVLNRDDAYFPFWQKQAEGRRLLTFGTHPEAQLRLDAEAAETRWEADGFIVHAPLFYQDTELQLKLALGGRHNLINAAAAAAAAIALGASEKDVVAGLAGMRPVKGRLQTRMAAGVRLIDDSYNANPDSVSVAIELLAQAPGQRWLVLGDLAELGQGAVRLHRQIGEQAQRAGIDVLWSVGELSREASVAFAGAGRHFEDREALAEALREGAASGDTILIKGSRSAGMEQVVDALAGQGGD
ncbi:UDP-N-acetylmuramoyl-tripeptide--D-alanyl-D-alanine ligase [Candidatus Endoriftia persephonae]|uniref:UDP-N-acetylmuramoyl-tripeptide--D-alanyl-D-alanine ligase n=2 Tax=Gammaproteobacteria TaxID=1236 RepID=G2FET7_9GAMM|nr:UDP-N-acetylmuramoyl-tripeptide--D-alanyl-D-alanine ligase [Candidatus Endoriftia persephone]EGW54669.1 UDP-N-acetylmuramoyl-tripeptide--D-alanyl-D-alanine ligase [endosymbiont of Tevnia jerichonana (vent Tica)]USF88449.1 UDP-N-acetylmuramoyl-tripeptide--D-alanyl-D-alanine ligase [Candidatus Endoriftia persephone]